MRENTPLVLKDVLDKIHSRVDTCMQRGLRPREVTRKKSHLEKDILSFSTANALSLISTLACQLTYARFSFEKLPFSEFFFYKKKILK
jgi:hypothetical protein